MLDDAAVAQLFSTYWNCIHPVWPILYKPIYDVWDYKRMSTELPTCVLYAIYAIAACIDHDKRPSLAVAESGKTPALLFESLLLAMQRDDIGTGSFHPLNMLRPSIDSCQALTILALQQHGVAEYTNAYLLCNLAGAMAIDLSLHDKANFRYAQNTTREIASRLWWNIFVLDKMLACELGRPVSLRVEEANVAFPSVAESDEYQFLQLYSVSRSVANTVKASTMSGFCATIKLTMIMEQVARQVYSLGGRDKLSTSLIEAEGIRTRLWEELKDFHAWLSNAGLAVTSPVFATGVAPPSAITNEVVSLSATSGCY